MATRTFIATGNASDSTKWQSGLMPSAIDTVVINSGVTMTVDYNMTVVSITNTVANSGRCRINNGCVLTANLIDSYNTHGILEFDLNGSDSATLVGSIYPYSYTGWHGVMKTGSGTFNILGDIYGVQYNGSSVSSGLLISNIGTVNIVGNVFGSTSTNVSGLHGISITAAATINHTGNIVGGGAYNGNYGVYLTAGATYNHTGNITGGTSILGNNYGIYSTVAHTLTSTGTWISSSTCPSVYSSSFTAINTLNGNFVNSSGINAFYGAKILIGSTTTQWTLQTISGNKSLYSADTLPGNPSTADVRYLRTFGPSGELSGTLKVPNPSYVSQGVQTDNTVGTMAPASPQAIWEYATRTLTANPGISAADIWNKLLSEITTSGSIGKLIKDYLDAAISSRLAASGYTAPDNDNITLIKAKTDLIPADPAKISDISALAELLSALDVTSSVLSALDTKDVATVADLSEIGTPNIAAILESYGVSKLNAGDILTSVLEAMEQRHVATVQQLGAFIQAFNSGE